MRVQIGHMRQEGASMELGEGWGNLGFSRLPGSSVRR